jgi:hypothetical protein
VSTGGSAAKGALDFLCTAVVPGFWSVTSVTVNGRLFFSVS